MKSLLKKVHNKLLTKLPNEILLNLKFFCISSIKGLIKLVVMIFALLLINISIYLWTGEFPNPLIFLLIFFVGGYLIIWLNRIIKYNFPNIYVFINVFINYTIATFILITLFAILYLTIVLTEYDSSHEITSISSIEHIEEYGPNRGLIRDMLYFSSMTYFTVGYGDFVPKGNVRFLVIIESYMGYIVTSVYIVIIFNKLMKTNNEFSMIKTLFNNGYCTLVCKKKSEHHDIVLYDSNFNIWTSSFLILNSEEAQYIQLFESEIQIYYDPKAIEAYLLALRTMVNTKEVCRLYNNYNDYSIEKKMKCLASIEMSKTFIKSDMRTKEIMKALKCMIMNTRFIN